MARTSDRRPRDKTQMGAVEKGERYHTHADAPKNQARSGGGAERVVGRTGLAQARDHLYSEHPHDWDQHGLHHGTKDHEVMTKLGGLRPTKAGAA